MSAIRNVPVFIVGCDLTDTVFLADVDDDTGEIEIWMSPDELISNKFKHMVICSQKGKVDHNTVKSSVNGCVVAINVFLT